MVDCVFVMKPSEELRVKGPDRLKDIEVWEYGMELPFAPVEGLLIDWMFIDSKDGRPLMFRLIALVQKNQVWARHTLYISSSLLQVTSFLEPSEDGDFDPQSLLL